LNKKKTTGIQGEICVLGLEDDMEKESESQLNGAIDDWCEIKLNSLPGESQRCDVGQKSHTQTHSTKWHREETEQSPHAEIWAKIPSSTRTVLKTKGQCREWLLLECRLCADRFRAVLSLSHRLPSLLASTRHQHLVFVDILQI